MTISFVVITQTHRLLVISGKSMLAKTLKQCSQSTFLFFLIISMETDINANVRYMKYNTLQEWKRRRSNCKLLKGRVL